MKNKPLELTESCKLALIEYQDAVNRQTAHNVKIKETGNKILLADDAIAKCHEAMSATVIDDESIERIIAGKDKIRQLKYEIKSLEEIKADLGKKLEELHRMSQHYLLGVIGEKECYWRLCYESLIASFNRTEAERILCCAYNANLSIRDVIQDLFNQREDNPDYSLVTEYQNQIEVII